MRPRDRRTSGNFGNFGVRRPVACCLPRLWHFEFLPLCHSRGLSMAAKLQRRVETRKSRRNSHGGKRRASREGSLWTSNEALNAQRPERPRVVVAMRSAALSGVSPPCVATLLAAASSRREACSPSSRAPNPSQLPSRAHFSPSHGRRRVRTAKCCVPFSSFSFFCAGPEACQRASLCEGEHTPHPLAAFLPLGDGPPLLLSISFSLRREACSVAAGR